MTVRPFLLLQSRDAHDPMRQHEIECFRRVMGVAEHELVAIDVLERLPTRAEIDGAAAFLMGGSGDYSCLDGEPWIGRLVEFIRVELIGEARPTFAACFGFQLLVLAVGGEMIRDPDRTELGTVDLTLTDAALGDPLFSGLPPVFPAQVGHQDRALRLPHGVSNLASSTLCPHHAIRVGDLPIWATQFHPELDACDVSLRYRHYLETYRPGVTDPAEHDAFERSLRPTPDTGELLRAFGAWVRAREAAARIAA